MAKIKKIIEDGGIQYPATITDAVKNPNNGKTVTEELSELGSEVSSMTIDSPDVEYAVADKNGNATFLVKDGCPFTKNFNGSEIKKKAIEASKKSDELFQTNQNADYAVSDNKGNAIFMVKKGYPHTKYFDGEKTFSHSNLGADFSITDGEYAIFQIINGYPITKNFNGENIIALIENANSTREVYTVQRQGYKEKGATGQTMKSFTDAYDYGFRCIECAVRLTSDNVPVLLHDETINSVARNADGSVLSEDVYINSITYEQSLKYDFGIANGHPGTKICSLKDFVLFCKQKGVVPFIESKISTNDAWNIIVDVCSELGMQNVAIYNFFGTGFLEHLLSKVYKPNVSFGITEPTSTLTDVIIANRESYNKVIINMQISVFEEKWNTEYYKGLRAKGLDFCVWGSYTDSPNISNLERVVSLFNSTSVTAVVSDNILINKYL